MRREVDPFSETLGAHAPPPAGVSFEKKTRSASTDPCSCVEAPRQSVVPAARPLQQRAQRRDRIVRSTRFDKGVLQTASFAKCPAAFRSNSRSVFSRVFSERSRAF